MNCIDQLVEFSKQNEFNCFVNQSLKEYTTFKIGGNSRIMLEPKTQQHIKDIVDICYKNDLPYFVLGKGSNLLISDNGIDKAVILLSSNFSSIIKLDETTIECDAGASLASVCTFAKNNSLSGLEFAFGIPGTIGGAVYMNAGAYGGEMSEVVLEVDYLTADGVLKTVTKPNLNFSYRHSFFSDNNYIITKIRLALKKGNIDDISNQMLDFLQRRKDKQPLDYPSAGSTFKRPNGSYASMLIDQCGLKGKCVGGAMVSQKHAGFVINYQNASFNDVIDLIDLIKKEVFEKTGFALEPEVHIIK